ncbi:hypothetical protein [Maridesulfovibrio sp.]|uniref:hypothetical protein n=1 Tax=Maridesulfovibrio sp. TaxID=2795000 RepID=UPI0029CA8F6E|nr:hypothetical protein [Maridesulfovibrio sp.]
MLYSAAQTHSTKTICNRLPAVSCRAQKYYTRLYSAQLMYAVCLLRTAKPKEALTVFKDCINSNSDTASLLMACSVGIMLKDNFAGEVLEILAGKNKTND